MRNGIFIIALSLLLLSIGNTFNSCQIVISDEAIENDLTLHHQESLDNILQIKKNTHNNNDAAAEKATTTRFNENSNSVIENELLPTSSNSMDAAKVVVPAVETATADSGSKSYAIRMLSQAFRFLNIKKLVKNVQLGRSQSPGACITCKIAMTMVKYMIQYGKGFQDVAYVTSYLCKSFNVQTPRVCDGYVHNFMEEFVVVMSKIELSSNEICGTLLGETCSPVREDSSHNWTIPLPPPQSFLTRSLAGLRSFNFRWPFAGYYGYYSKPKKRPLNVLQISDIHLDPLYAEGSNAVCGEPLCCRASSPGSDLGVNAKNRQLPPNSSSFFASSSNRRAGYWGDYHDCDVPLHTVEETFRFIRNNHPDIDYIIWTGDIPPHDIWNQTKASQIELINIVNNLFDQYFGHIPIYPVVGNHESLPMNSFPQPTSLPGIDDKYSKNWLYETLSEYWLRWLPSETKPTIERGAFFATRVKTGLKIISLNTNFCNNQNWWILLNSTDPGQQLEWLMKQLTEAEQLGEVVQILGHVPPGSNDCIQMWSSNYNRIVNRFAHIIKGQFFGHTHNDEFEIFYDEATYSGGGGDGTEKTYKPSNVAYIGPSVTTFGNVNPGYRIYTIDPDTFDVVDHHTYYMNLTEANLAPNTRPLKFVKSYSAKAAYGLKNLSAAEWHKLVMRMRTPLRPDERVGDRVKLADRLFRRFHRYVFNRSDDIGEENRCDDEACKYETLCRLLTAISHDSAICRHFLFGGESIY